MRFRLGLLSSMTFYPAPHAPPKVVEGARDPPDRPYSFPVPSRPPADACGAGFFSFFTANTREKSPRSPSSPQTVGVLSRTGIGRPGGRGSLQDVELGVHHSALGWSRCLVTTIGRVDHRMRTLSISICRAGTHASQRLLEAAAAKAWRQSGPVVRDLLANAARTRRRAGCGAPLALVRCS